MTAEIAIMNKGAVALAADSAVTIESSQGSKIKNSVNKLFALSRYAPVGIMVYGNAELMGVPWESIIKIYRKALGKQTYATLREYAEQFIKFLDEKNGLFVEEEQLRYFTLFVQSYFLTLRTAINKKVAELIKIKGKVTDEDVTSIAAEIFRDTAKKLEQIKMLPSMSSKDREAILKKYGKQIHELRNRVFEKIPIIKDGLSDIETIAIDLFVRDIFSKNTSGVVLAGFGEKETFPSLVSYKLEGIINGRLKYKLLKARNVDWQNISLIIPFAQSEMVSTFMEGIDPDLEKIYKGHLSEILKKYPDNITERIDGLSPADKEELKKKLNEECGQILSDFEKHVQEFQKSQHVQPITRVVSMLPKDELAAMAESLVNLTSFKRRVTLDAETVGGPIDVAVISKGDGFIWIKRKHYFSPQLNPHFYASYYYDAMSVTKEETP
jgi:hypothetical protein